MTTQKTTYQVKFNDKEIFKDVTYHLIRWVLLTVVTLGLALIVYPFYLVRFLADRISIVKTVTPAPSKPKSNKSTEEQPFYPKSRPAAQEKTTITRESVEDLRDTLQDQYNRPPADNPNVEVTSPPPIHVRQFHYTAPKEQPYMGTWTMPTGESGPTENPVNQPLDGYLDEEMKAGYVMTSMGFIPDSKDLVIVTEYYPDKANERQAYRPKPFVVQDGGVINARKHD